MYDCCIFNFNHLLMIPASLAKRMLTLCDISGFVEFYQKLLFMYIFSFKMFYNFFVYWPILFKDDRVLGLTSTKLQSKFQYNPMFVFSAIVFTRNVTDGPTDRRKDGRTNGRADILKVVQNSITNIMVFIFFLYERYLRFQKSAG